MSLTREAALLAIRPYVSEHGVVPSLSTLARLWGYASKASAAQIVKNLVEDGALIRTPAGRLRPGPDFYTPAGGSDRQERIVHLWRDRWQAEGLAEAYDVVTRITRLSEEMRDCAREMAALSGLTVGELLVLDVLYRLGSPYRCAPTELRHHFALTLPGIGKRIASLERQGLIHRVRSERDRRSLLVQLTQAGRIRLEEASRRDMQAPHIRWAAQLGPATRAGLIDLLRQALAEIEQAGVATPLS